MIGYSLFLAGFALASCGVLIELHVMARRRRGAIVPPKSDWASIASLGLFAPGAGLVLLSVPYFL